MEILKTTIKKITMLLLLICPFIPISAQSSAVLSQMNAELRKVTGAVLPTVVSIRALRKGELSSTQFDYLPFGAQPFNEAKALGSGVIIDKRGYIVTNSHVIRNAKEITISLYNKSEYKCVVVGNDPATDLAVIKISAAAPADLPVVQFADSDKLEQGQLAIAIGNAFGFSHTVTLGIISAVKREGLGVADYESLIQTDAAINPGNSGGALVDIEGKLIGINTAIYSSTGSNNGLGFAIPANMVRDISDRLIKDGKIVRGWLGLSIQDLTKEIAEKKKLSSSEGVLVAAVSDDGPAKKGGVNTGDVIVKVADVPAKNVNQLRKMIADQKPGTQVKVTLLRGGKTLDVVLTVAKLPDSQGLAASIEQDNSSIGIIVEDVNEDSSFRYKISDKSGAIVVDVRPGSPADRAGIAVGDIIKELDEKAVKNSDDLYRMVKSQKHKGSFMFLVKRGNSQRYVIVKTDES